MKKIGIILILICLAAGQPQQTPKPLPQQTPTEQQIPIQTPTVSTPPSAEATSAPPLSPPASNNPRPPTSQPTIAKNIPASPEKVTPPPATPIPQQPSLPVASPSLEKVPEKTTPPSPAVNETPLPASLGNAEGKIQNHPSEQTTSVPLVKSEKNTPQTPLPPTAKTIQESSVKSTEPLQTGPIPGPTPEINTNPAATLQQATFPQPTSQSSSSQTAIPSQAATSSPTPAVLFPRPSTEGPQRDPVEATPTNTPVPTSEIPPTTMADLLETPEKPSLTTTPQSIESQRVPPTAAQTAIVSSEEQQTPNQPSSPNTPAKTTLPVSKQENTPTKPLKPSSLTLNALLPSPASSSIIINSLLGILLLFALLQLLGLLCRKKKRYTQKFQEYSQRTQLDQMQGMD